MAFQLDQTDIRQAVLLCRVVEGFTPLATYGTLDGDKGATRGVISVHIPVKCASRALTYKSQIRHFRRRQELLERMRQGEETLAI